MPQVSKRRKQSTLAALASVKVRASLKETIAEDCECECGSECSECRSCCSSCCECNECEFDTDSDLEDECALLQHIDEEALMDNWAFLSWSPEAEAPPKLVYDGSSRQTVWRKKQLAAGLTPITHFFHPSASSSSSSASSTVILDDSDSEDTGPQAFSLEEAIQHLRSVVCVTKNAREEARKRKNTESRYDSVRLLAVFRYLQCIQYDIENGAPSSRIARSVEICKVLFNRDSFSSYKSRQLRFWASYFLKHGVLPQSRQGLHSKTHTLLEDYAVRVELQEHLASLPINTITARTMQQFVTQVCCCAGCVLLPLSCFLFCFVVFLVCNCVRRNLQRSLSAPRDAG